MRLHTVSACISIHIIMIDNHLWSHYMDLKNAVVRTDTSKSSQFRLYHTDFDPLYVAGFMHFCPSNCSAHQINLTKMILKCDVFQTHVQCRLHSSAELHKLLLFAYLASKCPNHETTPTFRDLRLVGSIARPKMWKQSEGPGLRHP